MKSRLKNLLLTLWVQIRDMYLYLFHHAIIVNGYVNDLTWSGIQHRNWGDDLNYYFLKKLTGRPVVMYHNFKLAKLLHLKNELCIGTIIDARDVVNSLSIVWGSGVSGLERSFTHPAKVLAVRGPKTKEFCDRYGISCPEVYGDPALLLPLVYKPRERFKVPSSKFQVQSSNIQDEKDPLNTRNQELETKRYRLGIIPHVVDQQHPVILEIKEKYADEILIIDLAHYKKWTDVIDQICSCERILSSSLHGIIVSDAYQIPNCWITLSKKAIIGHFKFMDYFSSVNRIIKDWVVIKTTDDIFHTTFSCASKDEIKNIQRGLLETAPFDIRIPINYNIDGNN